MAELTESSAEALPLDLVELATFPSYGEAFERALVVLAMGRDCWLLPVDGGHRLLVEPVEIPEVRRQLACYDRERIGWPPLPRPLDAAPPAFGGPVLWSLILVAVFWASALDPRLVALGEINRAKILREDEWWRIASALFLHADTAHLLGNAIAGIFAFSTVLGVFGRLHGWLGLGLSALAGNALACLVHATDDYRSIGASTAVFAAIGLLCGNAARVRFAHAPRGRRAALLPLATGCIILAMYGGSGLAHVDVLAHAAGFVCGFGTGLCLRPGRGAPPAA